MSLESSFVMFPHFPGLPFVLVSSVRLSIPVLQPLEGKDEL